MAQIIVSGRNDWLQKRKQNGNIRNEVIWGEMELQHYIMDEIKDRKLMW